MGNLSLSNRKDFEAFLREGGYRIPTHEEMDIILGTLVNDPTDQRAIVHKNYKLDVQTKSITSADDNKTFNVYINEDYDIVLPPLDSVAVGFEFTIKNILNDNLRGSFTAYGNEKIELANVHYFFGKGYISISKMYSEFHDDERWLVKREESIRDILQHGRSKRKDFTDVDTFQVNHFLGYIPIVQVWIEDGTGGYSDVSVDIDHEFNNMNHFTINLNENLSGFVLYI